MLQLSEPQISPRALRSSLRALMLCLCIVLSACESSATPSATPLAATATPTSAPTLLTITAFDVTIDGFTIIGTKSVGDLLGDQDISTRVEQSAGNVVIRNNRILDFGHAGVKPHGNVSGPLLIENNEFAGGFTTRDHGIYSSASDTNVKTIRYNFFHDISGYGVHIYHGSTTTCPDETKPRNHEVYGNVIVRNHAGGIVVSGPYNKIFNNVMYGNDGPGGGLWLDRGGAHHLTIKNNIIWHNADPTNRNVADVNADFACGIGNDIAHNDVGAQRAAGNGNQTDGDLPLDPQFVSATPTSWSDFRLKPTSPLLDPNATARLGATMTVGDAWPIGAFGASAP